MMKQTADDFSIERVIPATLDTSAHSDLRLEIQSWIAANDHGSPPLEYRPRVAALRDWQEALHTAGFVGLSWPLELGGRGLDLSAEAVFAEELARSSMPQLLNRLAVYTWGPTLMEIGTPEQCDRFLPGMLSASEIWCQGFSEPDAGSDLAAVRTAGVVTGDTVVISGQKVWTSRAELSKWNAMLIRTERGTERHRGLSVVIVDMESDGVTIRPLAQMLGEPHFSEVFFDDVEVPIDNVLGEIGSGWSVAMSAMSYERGLFVLERQIGLQKSLEGLLAKIRARDLSGHETPLLGGVAAQLTLLRAHVYRTLASQMNGRLARGSTSVDKLFLADVYQSLFSVAFDLEAEHASEPDSVWTHDLLESRSVSIYSGTSEIQRNVIASQLLGLPE